MPRLRSPLTLTLVVLGYLALSAAVAGWWFFCFGAGITLLVAALSVQLSSRGRRRPAALALALLGAALTVLGHLLGTRPGLLTSLFDEPVEAVPAAAASSPSPTPMPKASPSPTATRTPTPTLSASSSTPTTPAPMGTNRRGGSGDGVVDSEATWQPQWTPQPTSWTPQASAPASQPTRIRPETATERTQPASTRRPDAPPATTTESQEAQSDPADGTGSATGTDAATQQPQTTTEPRAPVSTQPDITGVEEQSDTAPVTAEPQGEQTPA